MRPLPNELLRDVYWSFDEPVPSTPQHLIEAVRVYAAELQVPDPVGDLHRELPFSEVTLRYDYWSESHAGHWLQTFAELQVIRTHSRLWGAKLLWELHVACAATVGEGEHHFFEGLRLEPERAWNEAPIYRVVLGS